VRVDRRLTITGEGWPVLDAGGAHQVLVIVADSVTVTGLVFRNVATSFVNDRAAVRVDGVAACDVHHNRFERTFFGVYLSRTRDCRVVGNEFRGAYDSEATSGNAVHLWNTTGSVIERNDVTGHRDGIYLEFARHAHVTNNQSHGNFRYGLHFMFSDSCAYERNLFTRNGAGVAVMYTNVVVMTGNRFLENEGPTTYGLLLKDINDSRVEGNVFRRNTVALHLEGSNRVAVLGNEFESNGWAVRLLGNSDDDRLERNRFVANSFDLTTNAASASATLDANEWDEYRGYDLDRDGFGDVPFRPVRLFAILVQDNEPALILLRSLFIDLLDVAERVLPVLSPQGLVDHRPVVGKVSR
jgi:nitrous oxidase accessory protein